MGLLDVLKTIGTDAAQVGLGGLSALGTAMQAQANPLAFQEQQENLRQQQQQQFQAQQRQSLSAYEQGMLDMQRHAQARQDQQQLFEQGHQQLLTQLGLARDVYSGVLSPTTDANADFKAPSGQGYKVNPAPPTTQPVHFMFTPEEMQAYPWLPKNLDVMPDKVPGMMKDLLTLDQSNPLRLKAMGDSLKSQVQAIAPNPSLVPTYHFMIDDAIQRGDAKGAYGVLDDVRKQKEEQVRKASDIAAQYSPAAISGAAAKAGAEEGARQAVKTKAQAQQDAQYFPGVYQAIVNGESSLNDALSTRGMNRAQFLQWAKDQNLPVPAPLSPAAQADLRKLQPVIDGLEHLKAALEPIKDNNNPAYFTGDRFNYFLGLSTPLTDTISEIERDRVQGGVRVLGSVRAYPALKLAMQHLPETWHTSPAKAYKQIDDLLRTNAYPTREDIFKYGNKYGVVQQGGGGSSQGNVKTWNPSTGRFE